MKGRKSMKGGREREGERKDRGMSNYQEVTTVRGGGKRKTGKVKEQT